MNGINKNAKSLAVKLILQQEIYILNLVVNKRNLLSKS